MTKTRLVVIALLLLLLGGCTTKIAYNYAHWWASWAMDDYIDLNRQQKAFFKQEFRQLHRWHRRTQLPEYVTFLKQVQQELATEVTPELLRQQAKTAQQLLDTSKQQAVAPLAKLLAGLSEKQSQELLQTLEKESAKYQKKNTHKSEEKRLKAQQKSMAKFAKSWLGKLSKPQKEAIGQWSQQMHPTIEMDLHHQQLWQQMFSDTLQTGNETEMHQFLDRYLLDSEEIWQPEYRQQLIDNQQHTRQLLATLLNTRTDKQRKHLNRKLGKLIKDFESLGRSAADGS